MRYYLLCVCPTYKSHGRFSLVGRTLDSSASDLSRLHVAWNKDTFCLEDNNYIKI